MISVGSHCLLELFGCPRELLDDLEHVERAIGKAARCAGSTLIDKVSHKFEPHGVTALALLAESHISVHTWPEIGYVACDAFTCGDRAHPERACESFMESFRPESHRLHKMSRGPATTTAGDAGSTDDVAVRRGGRTPRDADIANGRLSALDRLKRVDPEAIAFRRER